MKVVILAGGLGTRIREETHSIPKPMITIGERPILWHIMKIYSSFGFNDFIICLGYKSEAITQYFIDYSWNHSDVTVDLRTQTSIRHPASMEPWRITLANTGEETMTGGRMKRIQKYIGDEPFMLTYGDGLSDIPLHKLVQYHRSHGKLATVTAVQPPGRFGSLMIQDGGTVTQFNEKRKGDGGWISGGFFVLQPEIFQYLGEDDCVFEQEPLEKLAASRQLQAYQHTGFWYAMDTLKDRQHLQQLWSTQQAPWKLW